MFKKINNYMKRKDSEDSEDSEVMLMPLDDFIYKVMSSIGSNLENHMNFQSMSKIIESNMKFQNAISLLPEYEKLDNLSEMDKQKIGDL